MPGGCGASLVTVLLMFHECTPCARCWCSLHLILTATHFTGEEIEVLRGQLAHLRSHSGYTVQLGSERWQLVSELDQCAKLPPGANPVLESTRTGHSRHSDRHQKHAGDGDRGQDDLSGL